MYKPILLILLSVLILKNTSYPQWYSVENGSAGYISRMKFKDENTGWYTDGMGQIYSTTNASLSWKCIDIKYIDSLYDLQPIIISGDTIWISANSGRIIKSINSGLNWSIIYLGDQNLKITDFSFRNQHLIYGILKNVNYGGNWIVKSTNYGLNWVTIYTEADQNFENLNFLNDSVGFIKLHQKIIKTTNGGYNWQVIYSDSGTTTNQFDYLKFINVNLGFLIKDLHYFYRTSNGGANWSLISSTNNASDIYFENDSIGYLLSNYDWPRLFKTTNSGLDWNNIYNYPANLKYRIFKEIDKKGNSFYINAFAGGSILKSTNNGINWTDNSIYIASTPFYSIAFANVQTGFIGSYNMFLLKTTNSGNNWFIDSSFNYYTSWNQNRIKKIQFLNESTGWMLDDSGLIKTTNTGNSWNYFQTNIFHPSKFFFLDLFTGWITKDSGYQNNDYSFIYKTTNGGESYNLQTVLNVSSSKDIEFFNYQYGYIGFDYMFNNTNLYRTTNGGANWTGINLGRISNICIVDRNVAFVAQDVGSIYKTADGGDSWNNVLNSNLTWQCIKFFNNLSGFATSYDRNIYYTTNGGDNWSYSYTGSNKSLNDIAFLTNGLMFAVGDYGKIYRTDNYGGIISIRNINSQIPNEYKLYQNYPNPFNPTTNIRYQITNNKYLTIKVYNILGKEIATLVNEKQTPGTYEVIFDGSVIASGIYFYTLYADGLLIDCKKMILMK